MSEAIKKHNVKASSLNLVDTNVKQEKKNELSISDTPWIPFFKDSNNIYINDLALRARRSPVHGSIIRSKIAYACGQGFEYKIKGKEYSLNNLDAKYKKWFLQCNADGQSFDEVFRNIMTNFIMLANAYPWVVRTMRDGVFGLYSEDATKVRISKDKKKTYRSSFWRENLNNKSVSKDTPIDSDVDLYRGIKTQKEYLTHIKQYYPEFDYYGIPEYIQALEWADVEYNIPRFNNNKFKNGFFPSALVQLFSNPPEGMEAEDYVRKIVNRFSGEDNNSKIIVEMLDSPEQAAKIHEFGSGKDGEFIDLDKLATENIISGHRWSSALVKETGGKLGGNQQLINEYQKVMNGVVVPDFQTPVLREINKILSREFNDDIEISIIQLAPLGVDSNIDVNAVMTINEARERIGLESFMEEGEKKGNELVKSTNKQNTSNNGL